MKPLFAAPDGVTVHHSPIYGTGEYVQPGHNVSGYGAKCWWNGLAKRWFVRGQGMRPCLLKHTFGDRESDDREADLW